MHENPLQIAVRSADANHETLSIAYGELARGEAVVQYDEATATIQARMQLPGGTPAGQDVEDFHQHFAAELLAYVLNRGAMAQESEGSVVYEVVGRAIQLPLPNNPDLGLGYPNSW